jgi:hypothetical protein
MSKHLTGVLYQTDYDDNGASLNKPLAIQRVRLYRSARGEDYMEIIVAKGGKGIEVRSGDGRLIVLPIVSNAIRVEVQP